MKNVIINSTIKVLDRIAVKSIRPACFFTLNQPKEPKCLQEKK